MKITAAALAVLAAGGIALAAPAQADVFSVCPDGHEGVVGGHTSCAFAANVRRIYFSTGASSHFAAYSPVTGERYDMTCVEGYAAQFDYGGTRLATQCYTDDSNAEVVIW